MRDKIRELTKDTAIYGISTIVGRFLNFLLVPFYTHFISTAAMGVYTNVYAYLGFLTIAYLYGMEASFMKFSSLAAAEEKPRAFSTAYLSLALTTVILSVLLFLLHAPFNALMEVPPRFGRLLYYTVFILFFDTLSVVPFASLRLERRAKKFAFLKLANILLSLGLNLLFFIRLRMGIEAIFAANLIASGATFLALLPEILPRLKGGIDAGLLRRMLRFGLPYLPASLASMMVQLIDRPIVLRLTDHHTLGLYTTGHKLGMFMMLVVSMFQFAWQPFFLNNAREKNARAMFARVMTLFVLAAALLWAVVALFIDLAAGFEFAPGRSLIAAPFLPGLVIVPVVMLAYLFNGIYVNLWAGIYIEEKTKYFPLVTGAGALVNVAANFLLIPRLGIMGAGLAVLASYLVMALLLHEVARRVYPVPYEYGRLARILGAIVATAAVYYWLYFRVGIALWHRIALLAGFVALLFVLRVVKRQDLQRVMELLPARKTPARPS